MKSVLSSYILLCFILTLSQCNLTFYAMCVSCKSSTPSAPEAWVWMKWGARHWGQISAGLLCQLPEPVRSPCQQLEWVGHVVTPDNGTGITCVPKNQLLKGTGWVRWVRGLAKPVFLVPAAGQQQSAPSQNCVYSQTDFKLCLLKSRQLGSQQGSQVLAGSVLGCDSLCPWDKCVTAARLLQALSWTSWRVKTSRVGKRDLDLSGVQSSQRVCIGTQEFKNVCLLVILENSLLVEPAKRKVAAMTLSLGKDLRFLGTVLGRRPGMSKWRRQMLSHSHVKIYKEFFQTSWFKDFKIEVYQRTFCILRHNFFFRIHFISQWSPKFWNSESL